MLAALALASATPTADAEARLAALERQRAAQSAELRAAQAPLVRLLAAIERLALRPPALALAEPRSIDDMIHARALLAALRPAIAARTATLAQEMARTRALSAEAARTLARIGLERSAYEKALGARLMSLPMPPDPSGGAASSVYGLPARGEVVTGMGERVETGWRTRGLTLLTDPGAQVVAPAAARIAYAGPFGRYGGIVILDHGHGWTTLLAGLRKVDAQAGATVARGTAIGRMADTPSRLTVELRHYGRPVDIAGMAAQ